MSVFSELAVDAVRLAVNSAIIGSFLALSTALALRFAPNLHPRIRYASAVAAFLAAVIFPVFVTFQIFEKAGEPALPMPALVIESSAIENSRPALSETANDFAVLQPSNEKAQTNEKAQAAESFSGEITVAPPVITISPFVSKIFAATWLCVAFLLLAREILAHLSFAGRRRKWQSAGAAVRRRLQLPNDARVYLSDGESPLAIGLFRPAMVLPAGLLDNLSVEAARQIARHELNHVQWRDPSLNALLRLIRALFWINPALWYLERAARLEREAAADFAVIKSNNFDSEKIAEYAGALVEMAKQSAGSRGGNRKFKFVAAEIGRRSGLEKRVRRLFQASTHCGVLRRTLAFSAFCAGIFGAYFLPPVSSANLPDGVSIVAESGNPNFSLLPPPGENTAPEILSPDNSSTPAANHISETFAQTLRNIVGSRETVQPENKSENINPGENLRETPQPDTAIENASSENAPAAPVNTVVQTAVAPTPPNSGLAPTIEQPAPKNYAAPPNFLRDGMAAVGYANLSDEEIAALKRAGASHFTVRELASVGYANLPLKTLIRLRENGVNAAYIREIKAFGYDKLSPEMLVDFRRHGVSADYIRRMAALGYVNLTAQTLIAFRRNSVSASYIGEMRAMVKGGIPAGEMVDMKWLGVSRAFIEELGALGYGHLTANQLINMRRHGVTRAFIEKMRSRGGGRNYSANDLISMRVNGEK